MTTRQKVRLGLFAAIALLFAFVMADVLGFRASDTGVVSPTGYVEISHGDHVHYVPNGWRGSEATGVSISAFPTSPPPEGMTVSQTGQIVPLAE
ncbi:MAG: hypothetical protein AAGI52_16255 [Bacteroidota bacterium]